MQDDGDGAKIAFTYLSGADVERLTLTDAEILQAIEVDVSGIDAHPRLGDPPARIGDVGDKANLGEIEISIVSKQEIGNLVAGHVDIRIPIIIVVKRHHAEGLTGIELSQGYARGEADIFEGPISLVTPELIGRPLELSRTAVDRKLTLQTAAARLISDVVADIQVKMPVPVTIDKDRRRAPGPASDTRRDGHVPEPAAALIVVEHIGAVVGHEEIAEAIVVVIAHRQARAIAGIRHPRGCADLFESLPAEIPVELVARPPGAAGILQIGPVDQVEIQESIGVVIDPASGSDDRLRHEPLSTGPCFMPEIDPQLTVDTLKTQSRRVF